MLHLIFGNALNTVTVGPAPAYRIGGNRIQAISVSRSVAQFQNPYWNTQGEFFTAFECAAPALIRFEHPDTGSFKAFGPFNQLRFPGPALYADGQLIARFYPDRQFWHCFADGLIWPSLVLIRP